VSDWTDAELWCAATAANFNFVLICTQLRRIDRYRQCELNASVKRKPGGYGW